MEKLRLDRLLVEQGLCKSREQAQAYLLAHLVEVNGVKQTKPALKFSREATVKIKQKSPYVSRGGEKLSGALQHFNYNPKGQLAVDVGASTGGFTDCLLQLEACKVYAIDVGYGQLAWSLRQDARVVVFEKTNFRHFDVELIREQVDLIVVDVSFISLRLLLNKMKQLLKAGGYIVALVKPQFEVGRALVEKGGVVHSPASQQLAIQLVQTKAQELGFEFLGSCASTLVGKKRQNQEYFIHLQA